VTDLPEDEREGKTVSELDANIKKILLNSDEELENKPWCKVMYFVYLLLNTYLNKCHYIKFTENYKISKASRIGKGYHSMYTILYYVTVTVYLKITKIEYFFTLFLIKLKGSIR